MNPTVAMSLASVVLTALLILTVNDRIDYYEDYTSAAGQNAALVFLVLYVIGVAFFSFRQKGGWQGYSLPLITVAVIVPAFMLGTWQVG